MPYQRKTVDEFELQGHYGHGWEVLTTESTYGEAREQMKCYRENEGGSYRIRSHRVPITDSIGAC